MIIHMDSTSKSMHSTCAFFFGLAIFRENPCIHHGGFCGCVASVDIVAALLV